MMAIENPSFESPGDGIGKAYGWTETIDVGGMDACVFGSYPFPWDAFGEWWGSEEAVTSFPERGLYPALFEGDVEGWNHAYEGFESSWCKPAEVTSPPRFNHLFITEFSEENLVAPRFYPSYQLESFNYFWWSNQGFKTFYDYEPYLGSGGATSYPASFGEPVDPNNYDEFESGWNGNQNWQTEFHGGDLDICDFDIARAFEGFYELTGPGEGWLLTFSF